ANWVQKATVLRVAQLRAELGERAPAPEETWEKVVFSLTPNQARAFGAAMEMAAMVSDRGPVTPRPARLAAICMEYMSSAGPRLTGRVPAPPTNPQRVPSSPVEAAAAAELGAVDALAMHGMVPAPEEASQPIAVPLRLRARLEELEADLRRW